MKTPMQELILLLRKHNVFNDVNLEIEFLAKEKDMIINAYIEGFSATDYEVDSEQYYNDTFNKKETWYNEAETNERMNIIGQNGNDGEHYENLT